MNETPRRHLILIRALVGVSALVSAYLLMTSLQSGHVAGCGPTSGCGDVLTNRWAYWFGLPVSGPALLLYAAMFLATLLATPRTPPPLRDKARSFLSAAAWLVVISAAWFVTLQFFVVRQFCPYCLIAHFAGTAAALLILRGAPHLPRSGAAGVVAAVGVLLVGQLMARPAAHEVHAGSAPELSAPQEGNPRHLVIFDGRFKINIHEVPLLGARDAPAVMVSLLDYTCRHCRRMHGLLLEVEKAHRGRLAIAMLPMPLDAACNKVIPQTAPPHANACQYARLGLAVWRADPSKMERFNDWLFEPPVPPAMESALGYAQEIVGDEALGRAMNDPWVEQQLAQNTAIYAATYERFGKGAMPQLVVGDNVVFGELENGAQDLETLLRAILK
jgi:uncharacterized membrane protein/protein-disulfide isomerase